MKSNFNLPKRAPGPYGYSGDMESWEFQNNTSNLMLFLTDYFSEAPRTDPDTGETKATWRYDYEARFPEDTWTDIDKLQEFQSFVYSTYRNGATGNALPSPVTYQETHVVYDEVVNPETGETTYEERLVTEDVTYTTDTAAYRLSKFRNEFGKYAEVDSFVFYYIFTELFLMVDSRAKNLFIGFSGGNTTGLQHIDRKAVAEPYDMDTSLGINNEGALTFGYSLEDTDHLAGGANVFNGQNSVLWCNVRDAFGIEISQMYRTLRSNGILSYDNVEQRFEDHQSKWPEAVFNEDAWQKYINPLIAPGAGKTATASYLEMAQGSKKEQRKWWLYNRFRYMDSKWTAGDARSSIIELRGYAKADITVTPYTDIYPSVRYASYTVTERGSHGVPTTLECPIDTLNDSEIWIFSAPQLASVGDLSPLKVGRADFRAAVNLQSIQVGSSASGYTNPNLTQLFVGNNSLLRTIDARNCTALAGALDFSGASNVEHVYLDGTAVTSVALPVGGILKTLSLPDTITSLTVRDQKLIESFSIEGSDYSSVTTLRIENSSSEIPMLDILEDMPANSRVRIIGFTTTMSSTDDVEDFFDYLDTMRGMDESGNNLLTAVVSGTVTGLGTITGAWLAEMAARYPDVTIEYEHITSTLSYYSWDGETLLQTQTISDNGDGTYSGTPARTATAQYAYTFLGWSLYQDQYVADPNATKSVGADRSVYAAYSRTVQTYTVTWKNAGNTTLETDTDVPYGDMPVYNGTTPTYDGQTSTGWSPAIAPVTGNVTYTAVYIPVYQCRFYSGSSSSSSGTLLATIQVQQGSDAVYSGTTPTSSQEGFEFKGWDKPLTNIQAATDFYAQYRDTRSPVIQYVENTMTDYVSNTATSVNKISNRTNLVSAITSATNIGTYSFSGDIKLEVVDLTSTNAVTIGQAAFSNCKSLKHFIVRSSTMSVLENVSAIFSTPIGAGYGAVYVPTSLVDTYKADSKWSQFFITSIDNYPLTDFSTISDSWSQIIAAAEDGTASSKYSLGDIKSLDLDDGHRAYMQIAGFNKDVLTSDTTKTAGITFISRNPIKKSGTAMNTLSTTQGGWADTELRTYLNSTELQLVPSSVRSAIKQVNKTYYDFGDSTTETVADSIWIPSAREISLLTSFYTGESSGCTYDIFDASKDTKVRRNESDASGFPWWTRTAFDSGKFFTVNSSGNITQSNASYGTNKIIIGFCI